MCRRLIINAGIARVIARLGEDDIRVTDVADWVRMDDTVVS